MSENVKINLSIKCQNFLKENKPGHGLSFDNLGKTHKMNFEKFTIKSQEALQKSAEIATSRQQQAIEPGHLLRAILDTDENVSQYLFKKLNINSNILTDKLDEILQCISQSFRTATLLVIGNQFSFTTC